MVKWYDLISSFSLFGQAAARLAFEETVPRKATPSPLFRPPSKKKAFDEVFEQLLAMISQGRLKPGDKLPPERTLAEMLAVSRQTIREALKKAESRGLIRVRQGEGTFILSAGSALMDTPFLAMLKEEMARVTEFTEIRELIERWCARKAAELATPGEVKAMEEALARMEGLVESDQPLGQPDIDFHLAIAEASHNTLMVHLMSTIREIWVSIIRISGRRRRPDKNRLLIEQHREILEAIRGRDPDKTEEKMARHLQFAGGEWQAEIEGAQAGRDVKKAGGTSSGSRKRSMGKGVRS
jgi:GntR family transcriptional regulator, transcriptional repressor for pyruvate dehydrogenase complex